MSDTYLYKGKLVPIAKQPDLERACKELLEAKAPEGVEYDFYDSYAEAVGDIIDNEEYIVIDEVLYLIQDYTKTESIDFADVTANPDGSISFTAAFYNGGTCLQEVLSEEIEKWQKK